MRIILSILLTFLCQISLAQEDREISSQVIIEDLPIPREKDQLFYLQRDPDSNTIIYTLNLKDGEIDDENPVSAYWIRYAEKGQKENLSFIQRTMAYGIQYSMTAPNSFELHLKAYKHLLITLAPNIKTGKHEATVLIKGEKVVLDRIFVRIDGGSFFKPNIKYIEICGHSIKDNQKIKHRFIP